MPLKFPPDAACLVPGCERTPTHVFSVRMRRKDTGAVWAPNSTAYFCDRHAEKGAEISVFYKPTFSGKIEMNVATASETASRITEIR